jgi:type I restriction enzyme S subunit
MAEWKNAKVSDLGTIITGKTPTTKNSNYWNGSKMFVTPKDIQSEKHITHTERYVSLMGMDSVKSAIIPANSICVSCIGNIGYLGITTEECISNQQINSIVVNKNNDIDFVYYLMKSLWLYFKNYEGQSTTLSILNKTQFSKIEVKIPDISTQKNISSVLSCIDDKIAINRQINDNLLQQAQTLYHSWFVDFEPFDGDRPLDWLEGTIDGLAKEIICGKTPSTKVSDYYGNDIPFITIPDMHGNTYAVATERYLSFYGAESQSKKLLPRNSICVSCIGTAGLVTLTAYESQTNQQINTIIPKEGYSPYYIYLLMQTLSVTINNLGQSGSTIVNLNKAQFGKIPVIIPSVAAMKSFDEIVTPMFECILSNQEETIKLVELRDKLLPRLMSGELDVSNIEL